jgi:hypothetical protein
LYKEKLAINCDNFIIKDKFIGDYLFEKNSVFDLIEGQTYTIMKINLKENRESYFGYL